MTQFVLLEYRGVAWLAKPKAKTDGLGWIRGGTFLSLTFRLFRWLKNVFDLKNKNNIHNWSRKNPAGNVWERNLRILLMFDVIGCPVSMKPFFWDECVWLIFYVSICGDIKTETESGKLLGIILNNKLTCKNHLYGCRKNLKLAVFVNSFTHNQFSIYKELKM